MDRPVVLGGVMGVGKSTLAPQLAVRLGLPHADTDQSLEEATGRSVSDLFAEEGEGEFRARERAAFAAILRDAPSVVATGGGTLCNEEAWSLMRETGAICVTLSAPSDELARRVATDGRPLLAGARDAAGRAEILERLGAERSAWYGRASCRVDASGGPDEVVRELEHAVREEAASTIPVRLGSRSHLVRIAADFDGVGEAIRGRLPPTGAAERLALVTDRNVGAHWATPVRERLIAAGYQVTEVQIDPGERSKNLATVESIVTACLEGGLQRGSPVVALGGGVVGDVAGFAAAILFRGCPIVQLPTTLLAMVDSSIGGKTGVNHAAGKNFIGSFHQPSLVFAAMDTLATLEEREYRAGLGEVVKYGLLEPDLFDELEDRAAALLSRDAETVRWVVLRCAAAKGRIVEADEHESGLRRLLNLGHTVGHALEVKGGYDKWLHGEAVGLGLIAACEVGRSIGLTPPEMPARVQNLLDRLGLPTDLDGQVDDEVLDAMRQDKKADGDVVRFVVPTERGAEVVRLSQTELKRVLLRGRRTT